MMVRLHTDSWFTGRITASGVCCALSSVFVFHSQFDETRSLHETSWIGCKSLFTDSETTLKGFKPLSADSETTLKGFKPLSADSETTLKGFKPLSADSETTLKGFKPLSAGSDAVLKGFKPLSAGSDAIFAQLNISNHNIYSIFINLLKKIQI